MVFVSGLLTFFLVLDCIVLVLLVLIQLPKKEAGAGLAFGGTASDALFGAGSGNVLTKITKYAATIFFIMTILLSAIQGSARARGSKLEERLARPDNPSAAASLPPGSAPPPGPGTVSTNTALLPPVGSTNVPVLPPAGTTPVIPPPTNLPAPAPAK